MSSQTPYDSLPESQQLLLGYAAYKGTTIDEVLLERFAGVFRLEDPNGDLEALKEKGLYDSCWGLPDEHLLKVIGWVYDNHQNWPSNFEQHGFGHDENIHKL